MARFDRYMLSQLLWLFGFFALVLVAMFWISRAVELFDRLIADGQSALVFLEFTALGLPRIVVLVLPLATFAASAYVTNRLNNESELTVMLATGTSPWRLARPVLMFGLVSAALMALLTLVLVPMAQEQLSKREAEVSRNMTARLLVEGQFQDAATGVTFYAKEIGEDGVLRDVFLWDGRTATEEYIYTAEQAYLLRDDEQTTLIMLDGLAQSYNVVSERLSTATFEDFSFDITSLILRDQLVRARLSHMPSLAFIGDRTELAEATRSTEGEMAEEIHSRLGQPFFCFVVALMAFSTILIGGYSRFGVWREALIALALLLLLDGMRGSFLDFVINDARLWPLIYVPSAIAGLLVIAMLMKVSGRKRRRGVVAT